VATHALVRSCAARVSHVARAEGAGRGCERPTPLVTPAASSTGFDPARGLNHIASPYCLREHENIALKPHLAESPSRFTHQAHPHAAAASQGTGEEKAPCQAAHAQKTLVGRERACSGCRSGGLTCAPAAGR
jgi:hypothetical protein